MDNISRSCQEALLKYKIFEPFMLLQISEASTKQSSLNAVSAYGKVFTKKLFMQLSFSLTQ